MAKGGSVQTIDVDYAALVANLKLASNLEIMQKNIAKINKQYNALSAAAAEQLDLLTETQLQALARQTIALKNLIDDVMATIKADLLCYADPQFCAYLEKEQAQETTKNDHTVVNHLKELHQYYHFLTLLNTSITSSHDVSKIVTTAVDKQHLAVAGADILSFSKIHTAISVLLTLIQHKLNIAPRKSFLTMERRRKPEPTSENSQATPASPKNSIVLPFFNAPTPAKSQGVKNGSSSDEDDGEGSVSLELEDAPPPKFAEEENQQDNPPPDNTQPNIFSEEEDEEDDDYDDDYDTEEEVEASFEPLPTIDNLLEQLADAPSLNENTDSSVSEELVDVSSESISEPLLQDEFDEAENVDMPDEIEEGDDLSLSDDSREEEDDDEIDNDQDHDDAPPEEPSTENPPHQSDESFFLDDDDSTLRKPGDNSPQEELFLTTYVSDQSDNTSFAFNSKDIPNRSDSEDEFLKTVQQNLNALTIREITVLSAAEERRLLAISQLLSKDLTSLNNIAVSNAVANQQLISLKEQVQSKLDHINSVLKNIPAPAYVTRDYSTGHLVKAALGNLDQTEDYHTRNGMACERSSDKLTIYQDQVEERDRTVLEKDIADALDEMVENAKFDEGEIFFITNDDLTWLSFIAIHLKAIDAPASGFRLIFEGDRALLNQSQQRLLKKLGDEHTPPQPFYELIMQERPTQKWGFFQQTMDDTDKELRVGLRARYNNYTQHLKSENYDRMQDRKEISDVKPHHLFSLNR